jgi:hypothetical protein
MPRRKSLVARDLVIGLCICVIAGLFAFALPRFNRWRLAREVEVRLQRAKKHLALEDAAWFYTTPGIDSLLQQRIQETWERNPRDAHLMVSLRCPPRSPASFSSWAVFLRGILREAHAKQWSDVRDQPPMGEFIVECMRQAGTSPQSLRIVRAFAHSHPAPGVRSYAIRKLADEKLKSDCELFRNAATKADPLVAKAGLQGLGAACCDDAVSVAKEVLQEPRRELGVKSAAARVLINCGDSAASGDAIRAHIDELKRTFTEGRSGTSGGSGAARIAELELGDIAAALVLSPDAELWTDVVAELTLLESTWIRERVASALEEKPRRAYLPVIDCLAQDKSRLVRERARRARALVE